MAARRVNVKGYMRDLVKVGWGRTGGLGEKRLRPLAASMPKIGPGRSPAKIHVAAS
jgi:hypothetical protein